MVKLSLFPLQDRCSHFRAPGKLTDTQLEQGCTFWKEQLTVLNVRRTDARYVKMLMLQIIFPTRLMEKLTILFKNLIVAPNVLLICLHVKNAINKYFGKTID